jgi:hypothetical protein
MHILVNIHCIQCIEFLSVASVPASLNELKESLKVCVSQHIMFHTIKCKTHSAELIHSFSVTGFPFNLNSWHQRKHRRREKIQRKEISYPTLRHMLSTQLNPGHKSLNSWNTKSRTLLLISRITSEM